MQPLVSCHATHDPATYTGYVIELFRLLAHDQGWVSSDGGLRATCCFWLDCDETNRAACWTPTQPLSINNVTPQTEGTDATGDWYLKCMPYSDLMADMASPTGTCALAAAGLYEGGGFVDCGRSGAACWRQLRQPIRPLSQVLGSSLPLSPALLIPGIAANLDTGVMFSLAPTNPAGISVNTGTINTGLFKFSWPIYKVGALL